MDQIGNGEMLQKKKVCLNKIWRGKRIAGGKLERFWEAGGKKGKPDGRFVTKWKKGTTRKKEKNKKGKKGR